MYLSTLSECMSVAPCMYISVGILKSPLDLELKLLKVVSLHVSYRIKPVSFDREIIMLNCWVTSIPIFIYSCVSMCY